MSMDVLSLKSINELKLMNISFDLDSTLIPSGNQFETEKRSQIAKLFGIEKIRKGTRELIIDLQNKGYKINIYTTSYRKKRRIRLTLRYYGISVIKIVNQSENQRVLKSKNIDSSKYPTAFGFDLHIDDSIGVGMEAEKYSFKVIIVEPTDNQWTNKIKSSLIAIEK
jgi:hypothetical protein